VTTHPAPTTKFQWICFLFMAAKGKITCDILLLVFVQAQGKMLIQALLHLPSCLPNYQASFPDGLRSNVYVCLNNYEQLCRILGPAK